MNPQVARAILMIVGGTSITAIALNRAHAITKQAKKDRADIAKNTEKTIEAMQTAAKIMKDRIERGYYDGKPLDYINEEFEFETIIQFNK